MAVSEVAPYVGVQRLSRLLKYSPTYGLPPLALALFFRQVSAS